MSSIGRQMANGAVWMIAFRLLERSIGLISTVILARLLVPEDFGLVAMATAVMALLELLGAFSFDVALIQNQNANRQHFDTAWTLNVLLACFYSLALCVLALPTSIFYAEPRLENVMYCLSISPLMFGLENIGVVAFRKNLQFAREFRLLIGKKLVSFCVTVFLAYTIRSYWALVMGMLTGRLAGLLITYIIHPYRPRFCIAKRGELFKFSKWLLVNNLLFFFTNKFTDFVIGKMVGMNALGVYTISYEFSNLPTTEIVSPINRALMPGYSKMGDDWDMLRRSYLEGVGIIALISLPVGFGLAVVAEPFVLTVLGEKWREVIPLFQILALNGIVNAIGSTLSPLCIALGKPRILSMVGIMYAGILVPCLIEGANLGATLGAVVGMVIAHMFTTPIGWWIVLRQIRIKASLIFAQLWRPIFASLTMALSVWFFLDKLPSLGFSDIVIQLLKSVDFLEAQSILPFFSIPIVRLFLGVLIGIVTYMVALFVLWRMSGLNEGAESLVLAYISATLKRVK